ncbi:MAG: NUDIX hydrolase [Actinobacteria bacterium]|nr:NUDIX hydrolase [Actinomycetota bacterium]
MTAEGTFLAEEAWYAQLPTLYAGAGALVTDPGGDVLLVKPNYRDRWSLPGGILEHGEPPHLGCAREVAEELGTELTPGDLLVVDWSPPEGPRPRAFVYFVFDCGVLADTRDIRLQAAELDAFRLTRRGELPRFLPPFLTARVAAALRARATGTPVYLPTAPEAV